MEKQTFIAALLSFTKPIGYVILPYSCSSENEIFISLKERLTALNINQYPGLSEAESDFFKLSESFSNQAIIMQFSKKNQTPKDFFASLDKKFTDDMIRPYIGRKLSKIIETLLENDVPFYHLRDSSNLYPEDRISIQKESPRASLKFTRSGEGTQYKLSAFHQDEEIILNQPGNIILVNEPCYYLSGNKLYRFSENISGKLLTPFITRDFIHIPKKLEFTYFSTFIRKIANRCDIEAEGFQVNDLQPEPEAILLLELNWQGRLVLILSFQYGDKQVLVNNPQISFTTLLADESGFVFNRFKRSLAWEVEQVSFLKSLNLRQAEATFSLIDSESSLYPAYRLVEWLSENHTTLTDHSFIVRQPENKKYLMEIPVLNISLSASQDWFDVFGTVVIREFEIPFIKFRNHIIHNLKEYELPSGETFIIPDEWFTRYQDLMQYAKTHNQAIRINKHHFRLLTAFPVPGLARQLDDSLSIPEAVTLPALTHVKLRPYQESGFYWMHSLRQNGLGGILADDMGLGKTLQAIALLASYYSSNEAGPQPGQDNPFLHSGINGIQLDLFAQPEPSTALDPGRTKTDVSERPPCSLIILPASLIHNWLNEFTRFAPWLRICIHAGINRSSGTAHFGRYDIILTTYGTMRNDFELFRSLQFGYIILDESQTIKNPESKTTKAVFELQAQHRMVLTGTPIQNSLSDIWSQLNFLNPGMLGSHHHFLKYYATPLSKNQDDPVGEKLRNLVKPFILRRTKEEVAPELPALTETVVFCSMLEKQQSLYEAEKSKVRNAIIEKFESVGIAKSSVMVLRALMVLRQLANHPRMVEKASCAASGKFKEVTESLDTILAENHKVLIFSSFVRHLNLMEEYCREKGHKYALLTGSTTNREKVINTFKKKNDIQLFLISLKAGGVGLNLTEADYVFILDPWWNPAAEMQALNRAHRIGQDKKVFVYRFISKETVEEKIVQLQQKKKDLADLFVTSDSTVAGMTRDEILSMFA